MARTKIPGKSLIVGGIAGVAGVALLASGGGTFAAWSDSATIDSVDTITAGKLDITNTPAITATMDDHEVDLTTFKMVPGDVVTLEMPLEVVVDGDNLAAKLDLSLPNLDASGLAEHLVVSGLVTHRTDASDLKPHTIASGSGTLNDDSATYEIPAVKSGIYTFTATFKFNDGVVGLKGQGEDLVFKDLVVTLEQDTTGA